MAWSGKDKVGVAVLVHSKLKKHIEDIVYMNERIVKVTLKIES